MTLRRIFFDDFTGYADQTAFENAYPYDAPADLSTSAVAVTWGATNGPGGVPGVQGSAGGGAHTGSGQFDKLPLAPAGRNFRIKGRFEFPATYIGGGFTVGWVPSGHRDDDAASFVGVTRVSSQTLRVTVSTSDSEANTGIGTYFEDSVGALPDDTICDIQIDGAPSTITGTAGSYAPSSDGSIAVSVNGVPLFSFTGVVWYRRADINPSPYWNFISVGPRDRFTNFEVWDEGGTPRVDLSTRCCETPDGTSNTKAVDTTKLTPNGSPPVNPHDWVARCTGGGDYPDGTDDVNSEDWTNPQGKTPDVWMQITLIRKG